MRTKTYETPQQALAEAKGLTWAFVKTTGKVTLGPAPTDPMSLLTEDLLEARLFDEETEIRVYAAANGLQAVSLTHEDGDLEQVEDYDIASPAFGSKLTVAKLLQADEDGQINITAQRLCGWKGE